MITFFAIPKSFNNSSHIANIQKNAILSWNALPVEKDIVLLGKDDGVKEFAQEHGLIYSDDIKYNENGVPFVKSVFGKGEELAKYRMKCYINSDNILLNDFAEFLNYIKDSNIKNYLVSACRFDADIISEIDFADHLWQEKIKEVCSKKGSWHPNSGLDIFLYDGTLVNFRKPYLFGRPTWDTAFLQRALMSDNVDVIDATRVFHPIHQNHLIYCKGEFVEVNKRFENDTDADKCIKCYCDEFGEENIHKCILDCSKLITKNGSGVKLIKNIPAFRYCPEAHKSRDDYLRGVIDLLLGEDDIKDRTFAIFGTGQHTDELFKKTKIDELNILGVVDQVKTGKKYKNYRIYDEKELEVLKPDALIVSSATYQYEIAERLNKKYRDIIQVVTLYK